MLHGFQAHGWGPHSSLCPFPLGVQVHAGSHLAPSHQPSLALCAAQGGWAVGLNILGNPISIGTFRGHANEEFGTVVPLSVLHGLVVGAHEGGVSSPGQSCGSEGPRAHLQITQPVTGAGRGLLQPL